MEKLQNPRRQQLLATGIGVFIQVPEGESSNYIMIQASTGHPSSPICVEVWALLLAALIATKLNIQGATFLTDNLSLARAAASRYITSQLAHSDTRQQLAIFSPTSTSKLMLSIMLQEI